LSIITSILPKNKKNIIINYSHYSRPLDLRVWADNTPYSEITIEQKVEDKPDSSWEVIINNETYKSYLYLV